MNMPVLAVPSTKVKLPSSGKYITMRSMTTKEFKLFMIAKEGDEKNINHTILQMLKSCIEDDLKYDELPMYDIEYLFVQLYCNSTAESKKVVSYECSNEHEGEKCGQEQQVQFDIGKCEVDFSNQKDDKEFPCKLKAEDGTDVLLKFKQPSIGTYEHFDLNDFDVIARCLTTVATKDEMWIAGKDFDIEVAERYTESITAVDLEKITEFFYEVPELSLKQNFHCKKCGYKHNVELKGLKDFF